MNRWKWVGPGAATLVLLCTAYAGARGPAGHQKSKDKKPEPAAVLLNADQGTLQILVNGQQAGTEEFEIRPSGGGEWTARGTAELTGEGGVKEKVTGKMELTADGAPRRYDWTTTSPRKAMATVTFENGVARMELRLEGAAPYSQEFDFKTPAVVILDNNMYHHYALLAQLYDWERKEAKTFNVLIPQAMTPGSVDVEYGGQQVLDGQKVDVLRVHSPDLELELDCDSTPQHRMLKLSVPSAKAEILRQATSKN
jgi:hypothetical protein